MSNQQLTLFAGAQPAAAEADPLTGRLVQLPDVCPRCGNTVAAIGPGKAPHKASLSCQSCGSHRGWLSHSTYVFVADIANKFGCPTTPIVIRRGSMCPQSKEITDARS